MTFVVLTVDQFVGRDDGPLEQQKQDSHVCFFDKRGYPASVVQAGHHCAQQIDRQLFSQLIYSVVFHVTRHQPIA